MKGIGPRAFQVVDLFLFGRISHSGMSILILIFLTAAESGLISFIESFSFIDRILPIIDFGKTLGIGG
jgi:hypothetical protein